MLTIKDKKYLCTLDYAMELIKGKWKAVIICHLNDSSYRFLELQRKLPGVSQKILSEKLNELVEDKLIIKIIHSHTPPKVEYKLSEQGLSLFPIIDSLQKWSDNYVSKRYSL